jgi:UDP:flavonoid glycosyltransferase YjiC (YdhE family)
MQKFLLIPGNNSLSHVAKCLALKTELLRRGNRVLIAVSRKHSRFLHSLRCEHAVIPDIQEADDAASPTWEWFRKPERIESCIRAEIELMSTYRPDRVLGVFRFTAKSAAAVLGLPYDSLACGCMMPDTEEVLGYAPLEAGRDCQAQYLDNFFRFAAKKISMALERFGCAAVPDIRWMLQGDRTFLWDFPEFMPLPLQAHRFYVGPMLWEDWPKECDLPLSLPKGRRPTALISFGTSSGDRQRSIAAKLIDSLLENGYNVTIAAGGREDMMDIRPGNRRVTSRRFVPLRLLLCHVDLVVSHGGQMTIFEALLHHVPVLVMPFQPEQAHNGVCLERIGCGRRLVPSAQFKGCAGVYTEAFNGQTFPEIGETIRSLIEDPRTANSLTAAAQAIRRYPGAPMLAELIGKN